MSAPAQQAAVGPNTLITVKVIYDDSTRRFKIPMKDLGAQVFPQRVSHFFLSPPELSPTGEKLDYGAFLALSFLHKFSESGKPRRHILSHYHHDHTPFAVSPGDPAPA